MLQGEFTKQGINNSQSKIKYLTMQPSWECHTGINALHAIGMLEYFT